jgi:hypothetical protein
MLVERKLATGEERTIYPLQDDFFPAISADQYGEHWLYLQPDPANETRHYLLISNDGSTELMGEPNSDNPLALRLFDDSILSFQFGCESACVAELRPLSGDDPITFALPAIEGAIHPLYQPDDAHLLIFDTDAGAFWLLDTDAPATRIGYWYPQNVSTPLERVLSPDGRWLFVTDETANRYGVWDLANGEFVLSNEIEAGGIPFYWVIYSDGGFLVNESYQRQFLYNYADETVTQLPNGDQGYYFHVLPDGTLLYTQLEENEDRARGIHRYDRETDAYTLLVEDALPTCVNC